MKQKPTLPSGRGEQGQSLVELAMSLVFLLLLVAGAVDLGRAFFTFIALRDAAREGATYGSFHPTKNAEILKRVTASAHGPIDSAGFTDIQVDETATPACPGDGITVTVNYNFEITMPLLGTFVGGQTFPIAASVTNTVLASDDSSCTDAG